MKYRRQFAQAVLFLGIILLFLMFSRYRIYEMATTSMEPLIRGRGMPPSRNGDSVLLSKHVVLNKLEKGDLVYVDMVVNGQLIDTIREVEKLPGDAFTVTNADSGLVSEVVVPVGMYYITARSNGIDSRMIGPISGAQIKGKVIHIFRSGDPK
jgi:signal peptidase I